MWGATAPPPLPDRVLEGLARSTARLLVSPGRPVNPLVVIGLGFLASKLLKRPAADSAHPLATATSLAVGRAGQGATGLIATGRQPIPRPSPTPAPADLTKSLDLQTQAEFRNYAALNPPDLQAWLARYTGFLEARATGVVVHQVPAGGFQLSDRMLATMSLNAVKTLLGVLNGASLGEIAMDLTGLVGGPVSLITGVPVSAVVSTAKTVTELVTSAPAVAPSPAVLEPVMVPEPPLDELLLGDPAAAADALGAVSGRELAAASVGDGTTTFVDITGDLLADPISVAALTPEGAEAAGAVVAPVEGALPASFEGVPVAAGISNLGPLLQGLGVAGLAVDIGFTIPSHKADAVKAIDAALDAAALVCLVLAETGVGAVLAIVIEAVKFLFDLFGSSSFSSAAHAQREALETARFGQNLSPMLPLLANALTPRELLQVLIDWSTGYCGGKQIIAMITWLNLPVGTVGHVGGKDVTPSAPTGVPLLAPCCYQYQSTAEAPLTFCGEGLTLGFHGDTVQAEAQAGIA